MMFKFFKPTTAQEYIKDAEETYQMTAPKTSPNNELYRIGVTQDGMTTLTMISTDGFSMTMSMNPSACERMIRMIRATYEGEEDDQSEIQP